MILELPIEIHPFKPYLPKDAKILILGTFPPKRERWSMEFFYPNRNNDFWRIISLLFYGDKDYFYNHTTRQFDISSIKHFIDTKGIALSDTAKRVRRLKGNASDKFLEIIEPADIIGMLSVLTQCTTIATTGEKATEVLASILDFDLPHIGTDTTATLPNGKSIKIWRMPSTSRAYPSSIDKKAQYYHDLFKSIGLL